MVQNADRNLIVLTVYAIGIFLTFDGMIKSIDDLIQLDSQKDKIDEQLKAQNLQDKIGISFKTGNYSLDKVKDDIRGLSVSIENKSEDLAVYVDWDNCSYVVEHTKKSRRVIRISPDVIRDLAIPQVPTIIAPKRTISENVTAEDVLQRDKETGTYKAVSPLIDVMGLKDQKDFKKLFNEFMAGKKEIEFSLQLVFRISELRVGLAPGMNVPPVSIINCPFTIKKLPWTHALPWNKKKK